MFLTRYIDLNILYVISIFYKMRKYKSEEKVQVSLKGIKVFDIHVADILIITVLRYNVSY